MSEVLPCGEDRETNVTGISSHHTWSTKEETLRYQLEEHEQPQSDSHSDSFDSTTWFKSLASRCEINGIPSEKRLGVSFRDLQVYAFVPRIKYFLTFATAPGLLLSFFDKLIGRKTAERVEILRGLDGLVRSGEMLLVLGRPGSGCSTFLKVLAGEKKGLSLDPKSVINYEGISPSDVHSKLRGECTYTSEIDEHFPELTVSETLKFAGEARASKNSPTMSRREQGSYLKDCMLAMFRLTSTANTMIGNDTIRGVSGGEKKRVSIAEALMGWPLLHCWDNSTRGMDSSTALDFIQLARSYTKAREATTIVTIYQASQPILNTFDKVTVLYEGQQIFFGTMQAALVYFHRLGFERPRKMTTGDFFTSLTNPEEARNLIQNTSVSVPRTADDFALVWRMSSERKELLEEIAIYEKGHPVDGSAFQKLRMAKNFEKDAGVRSDSAYLISIPTQIIMCLRRGIQRLRNNIVLPISFVLGNFVMALIVGSIFYNLDDSTKDLSSRGVFIFFAVLLNAFMSAFEILTIWNQRPIVEKQSRYAFYHPFAEAISAMLCDMPTKLATSILFNVTLYFMVNLKRTAAAFFTFWLFAFVCLMTMSMFFRCVGSMGRTLTQVMVPFGVIMIAYITYAGFVIPVSYMQPWLRWVGYINPIAYAFESLMINEFHGRKFNCASYIPFGPGYNNISQDQKICSSIGAISGQSFVDGDKYLELTFGFQHSHLWRNLWILILFMVVFCGIHIWSSEYILTQKLKGDILLFPRGKDQTAYKAGRVDEEAASYYSPVSPTLSEKSGVIEKQVKLPKTHRHIATFHWSGLCYEIEVKGKKRRLLTEVDGWVKPGTLTALMGATGAGKTTLLDVLANRTSIGVVTGEVCINGQQRDAAFQRKTGFVGQQDLHLGTATVRETLQFSALLRQPSTIPRHEKLSFVEEVLKMLEMEAFADAIVGAPGDGLNVEQRRRLSIAVELAAKPELLIFLDEPTSGLDSQTAWNICSLLRKLANQGQAILCTIHQPSSQLLEMFDQLLLIEKGGRTLYFGEVGFGARTVISYFESKGARPCQSHENPAEWMFDVTSRGDGKICWSEQWQKSNEREEIRRQISKIRATSHLQPITKSTANQFSTSFFTQFQVLAKRTFTEYWRNPSYLWAKLMFCCGASLVIGFSCYKAPSTIQGLQTQLFAIFLLCTNFSNIMQQIIPAFVVRRSLFEARERPSRTYSWQAFLLSTIVTEAVWQVVMSVFTFLLFYYPIGMYNGIFGAEQTERGALMFLLFCAFFIFTSTLSHLLIAGFEDAETAVNIGQLVFYLVLIFCGVLVQKDSLPRFWIFMYRVSPLTYLVAGMFAAGVANKEIVCSRVELLSFNSPSNTTCGEYLNPFIDLAGGTLVNPESTSVCQYCPLARTNDLLTTMGIDYTERWMYFGIMFGYILFNVLATFLIYYLARVPRRQISALAVIKRYKV